MEYHIFLIYQKLTVQDFNFQLFGILRVSTLRFGGSPLLLITFYSNLSGRGVRMNYVWMGMILILNLYNFNRRSHLHFFTDAQRKKGQGAGLHFERGGSAKRFLIFDDVGLPFILYSNYTCVVLSMMLDSSKLRSC